MTPSTDNINNLHYYFIDCWYGAKAMMELNKTMN